MANKVSVKQEKEGLRLVINGKSAPGYWYPGAIVQEILKKYEERCLDTSSFKKHVGYVKYPKSSEKYPKSSEFPNLFHCYFENKIIIEHPNLKDEDGDDIEKLFSSIESFSSYIDTCFTPHWERGGVALWAEKSFMDKYPNFSI